MEQRCSNADTDDRYSIIESNPKWDKFDVLVAVAEVERIKMEEEEREKNLRQNLPFFLELCNFSKGKRSPRKRICSTDDTRIFNKYPASKPQFEFEDKHDEYGGNQVLFSYGNIIKKHSLKRLRCSNDEETEIPWVKKAKKARIHPDGPSSTLSITAIPEKFKKRIFELGGSEQSLIFVFQKVLTESDVNRHFSRLLVPFKQVKNGFLTDEEKASFEEPNKKFEIDAVFIDPSLDECRMNLRQWNMGKKNGSVCSNYSLVTHWSKVVMKNQLREGMTVDLWAFRRDLELGFALVLV